jgi:RNA polymerase sigma-70 factor, ECF subfamily
MPAATPSDHSLLRRFRDREIDAPTLLYQRYARRLRRVVARQSSPALSARVDHEDIVQSVFCDFFQGAAEGRYDVHEGEEIWKLLLVMTLNKIRRVGNFHRAGCRDIRRTTGGVTHDRAVESESGRDESTLTVLHMVIDEAFEILPPGQRSIVEMRVEGYEIAEIAERTRRSKRTVQRVLQEFRQRLDAQNRERLR